MARIWHSGFELNSTTDGVEFSSNNAPVSVVTTNPRSGTYHGRVNAGNGFWRQINYGSDQAGGATGYIGVAVLIHSAANATTQLLRWSTTVNGMQSNISLKTDNTLVLLKANGAQVGSASAALTTDTWYYVELKMTHNVSAGSTVIEARLNGSVFATGANSNTSVFARALIGCVTGTQTTNDIYFDDWKVNDSSGSSQTGYPDSGKLLYLRPNASGDTNSFAIQVGGTAGGTNNYTRVNEVTPDDATTYNGSAILSQEDLFNCDNSGINSYDTVNVVSVGIRMADLVSADATAAFKVELEKTASGTKAQSAAIIPNSTTWLTNATATNLNYPLVTYTDPDGGAWTNTTLDSMQIGYILTATNVQTIAISTVWASVDYTPGTPPAASVSDTLLMMGV